MGFGAFVDILEKKLMSNNDFFLILNFLWHLRALNAFVFFYWFFVTILQKVLFMV